MEGLVTAVLSTIIALLRWMLRNGEIVWWNLTCPFYRRWRIKEEEIGLLSALARRDKQYVDDCSPILFSILISHLFRARYIQPVQFTAADVPLGSTVEESMAALREIRLWAWLHPTEAGVRRLWKEGVR